MKCYFIFLTIVCFSILLFSCKKDSGSNNDTGLSEDIKNFVPQSVIDSMRKWGLVINEGKTPPDITGIYNITPHICTFDNSGYDRVGDQFADYRFRFRDQNNETLTITVDSKALNGVDSAVGAGSFIAGNNNYFTVFVNVNGVQEGIPYKQIGFYSGRKTENGIEDFQHAFYFTEKGPDPENKLVDVGSSRIFHDSDELSETNAVFRPFVSGSTFGASK